jgi:hypothetical protein
MRLQAMTKVVAGTVFMAALAAYAGMAADVVLKPADLTKLLPATVFYSGQTAPVQERNSGGVKFSDGHYVLAALVDTSGYSSGVAAKYQGYLITEVPLTIGGQQLPAGAYGFGFLEGGRFLVTNLGGGDVLSAAATTDAALSRPRPLAVTDDPAGGFRLYAGRAYIVFSR